MMKNNHASETQQTSQIYQLPNGMSIYHLNRYETDFIYKEVFENQIYLKHGIRLKDHACIFDIGANIGLFVMFAKQACPNAKILAFEPAPELCKLLCLNTDRYGSSVQVYQCGISGEEKEMNFTYYPNYSIMSSFHADIGDDKQTLYTGARNLIQQFTTDEGMPSDQLLKFFVNNTLDEAKQFRCRLRTVSSVIREVKVDRIDLLKIDAEKSELQILNGIDEYDWPRIDQVVMETHSKQLTESVISLLKEKNFKVKTEQQEQFINSCITNIFALRQ